VATHREANCPADGLANKDTAIMKKSMTQSYRSRDLVKAGKEVI